MLADLEHPRIARLLGGGTHEDRPYLVMEHVEGKPLDVYCTEHALELDRRIDLFLDICDAVDAAHRQLIVHRDLKPRNILVNQDGDIRLLDFGIAKLMDPESADERPAEPSPGASPEETEPGRRALTPCSPPMAAAATCWTGRPACRTNSPANGTTCSPRWVRARKASASR